MTMYGANNWISDLFQFRQGAPLMTGSFEFAVLFTVFLAFYVLLRKWSRLTMMLYVIAFSLFFAYKANGYLAALLPLTALVNYGLVEWMKKVEGGAKKCLLAVTVVVDLGMLAFFKYARLFQLELIFPIGISFYTFQAVSYAVDVYRGTFSEKTGVVEYLFYLTFFPLLLAGPITRAENLIPALKKNQQASREMVWKGLFLIMLGLLKKNIISDYVAQYNNLVFDSPVTFSGFEAVMAVIGYSVQIFLDFSGYSDMSIGIASIMGFSLPDNFWFPYRALNLTDFWRRWHISLSTWFRDYLYIPLGGNRKGAFRMYMNNIIVMLVAGIWHGSTLMFVIWGGLHGIGLVVHKIFSRTLKLTLPKWCNAFCWLGTYLFLMVTWTFFRAGDIDVLQQLYHQIYTNFNPDYLVPFVQARTMWVVFVVLTMLSFLVPERGYQKIQELFIRSPWIVKLLLFICCLQLVIEISMSSVQPFIYYNF